MYITNVSYSVNSKYLTLAHSLIDGRRLNVTSELSGTVTKALLHGELFVMPADGSSNKYYSFMKKSLETCKFLANPESEPILNAIWQEMAKDSRHNIALKCPVQPVSFFFLDRSFVRIRSYIKFENYDCFRVLTTCETLNWTPRKFHRCYLASSFTQKLPLK